MRNTLALSLGVATLALVAACSQSGTPGQVTATAADSATSSAGEATADGPSPTSEASTAAPTSESPATHGASHEPITLAFVGDMHAEGGIRSALNSDPASLLAGMQPAFDQADLVVGNVETAITTGGKAVNKKYVFRAPPSFLTALSEGGIDIATVANNHGMDYGASGFQDTLTAFGDSKLGLVGAGKDEAEAYSPDIVTVKGVKVAVIGATQVLDAEFISSWTASPTQPGLASAKQQDRLVAAVHDAKAQADVVVVFLHWGTERSQCPNPSQKEIAPKLAAAGAQIVVGSHAHVLVGGGYDGATFVNYGLGNFLFYSGNRGGPQTQTGVQLVTVTDGKVTGDTWLPAKIGTNDLPTLLEGEKKAAADASWQKLRECTGLTATPQ